MSIAPILQTVQVKASPARAFELFTARMGDWWPRGHTIAPQPHVEVIIEPHVGGRWFERDAAGAETQWGQVLEWQPPVRVLLAWQIDANWKYDPALRTEVELSFEPAEGGGTLVRLEHRNLERFGSDAVRHSERLRNGWPGLVQGYASFSDSH